MEQPSRPQLPSEQPTQTLSPPLNTTVATTASFAAASTAFGLPHRENREPRWTRYQRNEDEEDSRECHRRGYERPRSPLNQVRLPLLHNCNSGLFFSGRQ